MVGERERTIAAAAAPPADRRTAGGLLRREDRPGPSSSLALGLELTTLDAATARRLGLPESLRGAAVVHALPESPLASLLQPNDVISSIDGRPVASAEQANEALNAWANRFAEGPSLVLGFDRYNRSSGTIERRSIRVPR
jgi:S1-C subfamily serine protease